MKRLDIDAINSHAPYNVKEDIQEGAYTFIAEGSGGQVLDPQYVMLD